MSQDIVSLVPDFCEAFVGKADVAGGIALVQYLERDLLDFSLDSLHALDRYLNLLFQQSNEIDDQSYDNTILAAGSYLGEVIRRNAQRNYKWVNYSDYFATRPELTNMIPECLPTSAILAAEGEVMTMPLNKIARFIDEGPENNTHYYAAVEIKQT